MNLLGPAQSEIIILDANDPRKVIVKKLALCVPDREDMELGIIRRPHLLDFDERRRKIASIMLMKITDRLSIIYYEFNLI